MDDVTWDKGHTTCVLGDPVRTGEGSPEKT